MFFLIYLRRELRARMLQALLTAAGLGVGVGLVATVTAASAGVAQAQAQALHSLYGIGTDVAVTPAAPHRAGSGGVPDSGHGEVLWTGESGLLSESAVRAISRLKGVAAAAGGLRLTDLRMGSPETFTVDGVDVLHLELGPLASGVIRAGKSLRPADAGGAVVDAGYARANNLTVGSAISLAGARFTVVGLVEQAHGAGTADVYVSLASAQSLGQGLGESSLRGEVNVIYVAATGASAVPAVRQEISTLLPFATVATSSDLAGQVSGSLAGVATLIDEGGRWMAAAALLAAVAAASVLTMAAVARRTRELGTLKALGWSSRRIVAQIQGESLVVGAVGAGLGIGLGSAGAALVDWLAPAGAHLQARVTGSSIGLAVALAVAGALVAGSLGGWRAARMQPVEAFAFRD